jgi:hypothetical protein
MVKATAQVHRPIGGGCYCKTARPAAEGHAEPVRIEVAMLTNLLYVGATLLPHGKGLRLTGQLGEATGELARTAQSFVWLHADALGIDLDQFRDASVQIHGSAGAVPKDGPSVLDVSPQTCHRFQKPFPPRDEVNDRAAAGMGFLGL